MHSAFDTTTYTDLLQLFTVKCWQTMSLKWNDHTICATKLSDISHCQKCHVEMMWLEGNTALDTYCSFPHPVHQHSSLGQQSTTESSFQLKNNSQ